MHVWTVMISRKLVLINNISRSHWILRESLIQLRAQTRVLLLLDLNAGCPLGLRLLSEYPSRCTMYSPAVPRCRCLIICWKQPVYCMGLKGEMTFHTQIQTHRKTHTGLIKWIDTVAWRTTGLRLIPCSRGNVVTEAENGKWQVALAR